MTKKKILAVGEFSRLYTGYSNYLNQVLTRLHNSDKVQVAELACYVSPDNPKIAEVLWKVYPNQPGKNDSKEIHDAYNADIFNSFGRFRFHDVLLNYKPDVVLSIRDVWMDSFIYESPLRPYFKWIWLNPCDAIPQAADWLDKSVDADGLLAYTDWGKDVLNAQAGRTICRASAPPSVDPVFRPIEERRKVKEELGLANTKIVGMVARNQARKCIPELMEVFRVFLNNTGMDAKLYLHTSFPDSGFNIPQLLLEYDLCTRVLFTYKCRNCGYLFPSLFNDALCACKRCKQFSAGLTNVKDGATNEELCFIYNLFDLYVQFATNEGFGIPVVEAAACGIPVVAVDYSAMSDVVRKVRGLPLPPASHRIDPDTGRFFAVPDNFALLTALEQFFRKSDDEQDSFGQQCRMAFEQNYSWDATAKVWENLIDSMDVSDVRQRWTQPPDIRPIPNGYPQGLTNSEFAYWLVAELLGRPDKIGSYLHLRVLKDLNYGVTTGGLTGKYYNEMSTVFSRPQYQDFTQQTAFSHFCGLRAELNEMEKRRVASLS